MEEKDKDKDKDKEKDENKPNSLNTSEEVSSKSQEITPNLQDHKLEIIDSKDIESKDEALKSPPKKCHITKKLPIGLLIIFLTIILLITFILIFLNLKKPTPTPTPTPNIKPEIIPINEQKEDIILPKIGLCVPAKHENKYIREYVEYYKKLGVTKIYIYDNNEVTYEKVNTKIQDYIDSGFVEILYLNIKAEGEFDNLPYNSDCYVNHKDEFDWMFFFDVDEFFYISTNETMAEYLNNTQFDNCDLLLFNWVIYDDNDELTYSDRPCQERFKRPMIKNKFWNKFVKSVIRTSVNTTSLFCHVATDSNKTCNSKGKNITPLYQRISEVDYNYAYIKHYCYKSCEEYVEKLKKFNKFSVKDKNAVRMFFCKNIITEEKIKYFEKVFLLNLDEFRSKIGTELDY